MAKQNKGRKFFAASATAALVASAIVPVASAAQVNDYNKISGYAKEAVQALVDQGVIQGDTNGNFNPLNTVTRAQAAEIFTKALELEANGDVNFKDVKAGAWYYNSIAAVVANGIFEGVSATEFAPNKSLTRSEAAKILVEAFGLEGEADLSQFADASQVKPWAKKYLEIAVANGVFEGTDANKLNPNNSITRQDFALVFKRTVDKVEGETPEEAAFVKAINNTTVEVTFEEEVTNVQALNFKIEGLEIKNASVKQTNKKVVVLTTEAQTADKEYVLTLDGETIGGFKGVAAVVPTKVELVSSAVQGKLGQEVKVQAKVTVAEGQSKAGIPVTFTVPGNNNDGVVPTLTGEALTNEEGIATYSYTRYKEGTDEVTAYATGDRSKFSLGYVFWGVDTILSIQEVTTGATINNGANKTYKVTYKNPKTGKPEANKTFNVGFVENMNVTSDKVANATVNGVKALQLSNNTALDAAQVTTDSKGEATFTVSGTNAEVTPVVYALNTTAGENAKSYKTSALQVTASKVKFAAVQADYTLELTRTGGEVAATGQANGREYKVVVKDKDGKLAKNEVVNVAFNEDLDRVISTVTDAKFIDGDNEVYYTGTKAKQITVKTDEKGEATFVIGSDKVNDYATPVAWIDINTSNAKEATLDEGEPKAVAPISYFQTAYLDGASVKSYDLNNKKQDKFKDNAVATFKAQLVNQSDKVISATIKSVSYTVFNTGSNDIEVTTKSGKQTVSPNRSITLSYTGELSSSDLQVNSVDGKSSSVRVVATGVAINPADQKDFAFTAKEATATFTASNEVVNNHIGKVVSVNTTDKTLTFDGKKAISLKDAKFVTENNAELADLDAFVVELEKYTTGVEVQYSKDSEGKVTFKIVRALINGTTADKVLVDKYVTTLNSAKITVTGTATTLATTTIDSAQLDVAGKTLEINGVKFERHNNASPEQLGYFSDLNDLANKINKNANIKVKAEVLAGNVLQLTDAINGKFEYTLNGNKLSSSTGTVGVDQEITFTFTSGFNVATGDKVTVNGTTTGTVASVSSDKKTVVVKFTGTGITTGTAVTTFAVVDKAGNTITVAPSTSVQ
ncbi:S-layer homology domain-containing protein [Lysinibacillus capsici]|uniref:S-layer homology domain-containing protein n=1 Tax=Lysinibacillus capsici TaxID=2115968 RepID=UPI0028BEE8FD|nr:S-layer homology domain-containing protein [Lysinibacillus capsici]WNN76867.1 S-layer homology domain-containing protein [Lysinibacillus capsici]